MVDKRIVDWIKSEEAQGYSEEQLKQSLLKQGYNQTDVNEAISISRGNSNLGFNQFLSQKGTLFTVLFYILLVIFSLQLVAGIIISLIQLKFINLIFPLLFGGLIVNYIRKKNLYEILMTIFLLSPIGLLILREFPLLQSFMTIGNVPFYVLISIHTLIVGLLIAFMFSKVSENFKKYLTTSIIFSSFIGLIFAINSMIGTILSQLSAQLSQLSAGSPMGATGLVSMFNSEIFNANIAFILAFIFFNIPYVIFYLKREDKNPKLFLLYLIPIILFILLSFILKYVANMILATII
ncbi:MAG: hypothetical protein ACMXYE_03135 [Candidatus Woesearchaeota archaeon]